MMELNTNTIEETHRHMYVPLPRHFPRPQHGADARGHHKTYPHYKKLYIKPNPRHNFTIHGTIHHFKGEYITFKNMGSDILHFKICIIPSLTSNTCILVTRWPVRIKVPPLVNTITKWIDPSLSRMAMGHQRCSLLSLSICILDQPLGL